MAHLIDKDALVAEIEKLIEDAFRNNKFYVTTDQLNLLKHRINTLEVKEVDLEKESLTWEDIPKILSISSEVKTSWWFRDRTKDIGTQIFWEEVLKRYKAQKGEEV